MPDQLFATDFTARTGTQQPFEDAYIFEQRDPLDQTLLHDIETELAAITGCARKDRVKLTVCNTEQWRKVVEAYVPAGIHRQGLAKNFRVLKDPRNPRHLYVGPSAVSGLNDRQSTVVTDLVHQMINALDVTSNQAFERGAADLIAAEIGQRLDLPIFTPIYPAERQFVSTIIEAVRKVDEDPAELLGLLKRKPSAFFKRIRESGFYRWWENSARNSDQLVQYVDLIASITSPNAQLEGSFMAWAYQCASIYVDYRIEQRRKAQLGAAARWADN